jgi:predicted Zn-dependent protease
MTTMKLLQGTALVMALMLGGPGWAQSKPGEPTDGVRGVRPMSAARMLVSADQVEGMARQQYVQMTRNAASQRALAPDEHPEVKRLRDIARRLIPHAHNWNERAQSWQWEVNLIGSKQINAFCMPGGKIAFFTGILQTLKLTDDEVAMVMGHEMAHALREHGRERIGKQMATHGAVAIGSALLGLGSTGQQLAGAGANLLLLKFSREDESEADLIGMDLAARAGFDPRAGVTLWQKMAKVGGTPPQWLSTHPSGSTRIEDISKHLPEALPLLARARGVAVTELGPYNSNVQGIAPVK